MNAETLQKVVDRAHCRTENDKQVWSLSEADAQEFVRCVDKYVKKSVFKSDIYDPEDAYGDILLELWRCLTKYGPRPNGKMFGEYVLPLKTNNILTNRANKRKSFKSRVNYLTAPFDPALIDCVFFELPFDKISFEEQAVVIEKQIKENKRINSLYKKVKKELAKATISDVKIFNSLYLTFLKEKFPDITEQKNKVENTPRILYDHGKNLLEEIMREFKIGDKLISPGGKVIEIRRRTESGFIVNIPLIDQEVEIDFVYAKRCNAYDLASETSAETPKEDVEDLHVDDTQVEETKKLKVYAKKIVEEEKKSLDNIEIEAEESGAAFKVIIELLKTGPQSRELLARALVGKGLSKSNDVEKSKGYVSVLVSNIKKAGQFKIESPKRGVYQLVV